MLARVLFPTTLLVLATALPAQQPSPTVAPNAPSDPAKELPYDRGYDKPSARADAVNAQEAPVTARLNQNVGAAVAEREAVGAAVATADADAAAAAQAHYDEDMAAYEAAVRANARQANRDQARYDRQQHAYAEAMRAWRTQTYLCEKGKLSACKLPTPNPADYY